MMDTQVATAIVAGVFGSVITPLMPKILERIFSSKKPKDPKANIGIGGRWAFLQAVIGGIVGVLVGYFAISPFFVSECSPFSAIKLDITSPVPGSNVSMLTPVQGKACNVSKDEKIWVLVLPDGIAAYYPQPGPVIVSADGQWSSSAYVGLNDPVDVGRGFTLVAVLANNQGDSALQEYLSRASSGAGQTGLALLPSGVRVLTQVHVVRK